MPLDQNAAATPVIEPLDPKYAARLDQLAALQMRFPSPADFIAWCDKVDAFIAKMGG